MGWPIDLCPVSISMHDRRPARETHREGVIGRVGTRSVWWKMGGPGVPRHQFEEVTGSDASRVRNSTRAFVSSPFPSAQSKITL